MPASGENLGSGSGRAWEQGREGRVGKVGGAENKRRWGARIEPGTKRKQEVVCLEEQGLCKYLTVWRWEV